MALKQQEVTSYTKNRVLISRAGARKRSPNTVLQRRDQHSECSRALARQNSIFTQQIFARSAEHASAIRSFGEISWHCYNRKWCHFWSGQFGSFGQRKSLEFSLGEVLEFLKKNVTNLRTIDSDGDCMPSAWNLLLSDIWIVRSVVFLCYLMCVSVAYLWYFSYLDVH